MSRRTKDLTQRDDANGLAFISLNIRKLKLIFWLQIERERLYYREYPVVVKGKRVRVISEGLASRLVHLF